MDIFHNQDVTDDEKTVMSVKLSFLKETVKALKGQVQDFPQ